MSAGAATDENDDEKRTEVAWLKTGDTAAMDERVLNVAALTDADERSVNEVFGFVMRMYIQAAQQETDYLVSLGTAMVLSPRYEALLALAARTGLLKVEEVDGMRAIRLVQDGDFLHMRSREEMEWERQRKADIGRPELTVPVRLRDGDACRYCGCVVSFGARRGGRAGTYDHRTAGKQATNERDLVVACAACNAGRGNAEGRRDALYPLMPPPAEADRYFSKSTIGWLEDKVSVLKQLGLQLPARPKGARDKKPGTPTRSDVRQPQAGPAQIEEVETAAPASSGEQRPTPTPAPPADAAPHSSGEQRAGGTSTPHPVSDEHQRATSGREDSASATSASSEGTRADHTSTPLQADAGSPEVHVAGQQKAPPTCTDAVSAEAAETESPVSGDSGSGRDGSGRAGPGRAGAARGAGPRPQGAGPPGAGAGSRRKRGHRRRGRK